MKVNKYNKKDFLDFVFNDKEGFLEKLKTPEALIIREFYPSEKIHELRNLCFDRGITSESTWHPLKEGCPDYHRLHDNYPGAYVKQKFHAFYHHGYLKENEELFQYFSEIFELKNYLSDAVYSTKGLPLEKLVARINVHHYPVGGGYQAEHIDPARDFARIQTLICGSKKGVDFQNGGVFGRMEKGGTKYYLDDYLEPGDLLIISPDIHHGVDPIDPNEPYSWNKNSGRWMILPLFVTSDYNWEDNIKPKQVS